jgi:hypothetical protein
MRLHSTARAACLLLLLVFSGCEGRPDRVPVSGKVLIDGQPLTRGYIRVVPSDARASGGEIGPDGRFTLGCFEKADGCVVGTYPVSVYAAEPLGANAKRWLAPRKYADPATSGLTVDIKEPTDSLVIELSWDGGKPFVERLGSDE